MLSCDKCQRNNLKLTEVSGELHFIPVKPELGNKVGMDLIDPLVETPQDKKYIVTITEHFLKWTEVGAPPNKQQLE